MREGGRRDVLDAVRRATSEQHQRLERLSVNVKLLRSDVSVGEYAAALRRLYGFYLPLAREARERGAVWRSSAERWTRALTRDLLDLGWTREHLDAARTCAAVPVLDSLDREFGCGYVMEGAALGGLVLGRHFRTVFAARTDVPYRFFQGRGDGTRRHWQRFCAEVNARARSIDAVRDAARETYDAMAAWLTDPASTGKQDADAGTAARC